MDVEEINNNGQQAHYVYDLRKIFIRENRYESANYTNSTYDDVVLAAGTLMGRIGASQKIVPLVSDASDGSQYPVGVLAEDRTIEGGDTVSLTYCIAGDVAEEKLILDEDDDLDTLISGRSIRDRIKADTMGIKLVACDQLTGSDNQ